MFHRAVVRGAGGIGLAAALLGAVGCLGADVVLGFAETTAYSTHERAGAATFVLRRSGHLGRSPKVGYRTLDSTALAGRDYVATQGTLVFAPEEITRSFTVPLLDEPATPERLLFRVALDGFAPEASLEGVLEWWATILGDASPAVVSVEFSVQPSLASSSESGGSVAMTVVRSGATDGTVRVGYATADRVARAGEDYVAQEGVLVFGPGEKLKTITVQLVDDRVPEGDEVFELRLGELVEGAQLGAARTAVVQILDEDAPAELEPSFRVGTGLDDRVRALLLQPDGRLLVAGDFNVAGGLRRDEVARFHPDGTLDAAFDAGPALRGRLGLGGLALALQADGKILVGGDFNNTNDLRQPILVRLDPDGRPDPTFAPVTSSYFRVRSIIVQEDQGILVGGYFGSVGGAMLNVMRFDGDGSPDPSFRSSEAPPNAEVLALALQPDGKIILGGNFLAIGTVGRTRVARLNSDGTLDPTFDPGSGASKDISAVLVQPDGKILVAGEFFYFRNEPRSRIARLNPDGTLDPTFAPAPGANREIHAMALQPDGKILIGGEFTEVDGVARGRLARLNPDGTLDPEFSVGPGADEEVRALALASDSLYVGGDFSLLHRVGLSRLGRMRLEPAGGEVVSLMLAEYEVREGMGALQLSVLRQGTGNGALSVGFTTVEGSAGTNEFVPQAGVIEFAPGESRKRITIPLRDDPVVEDAKVFTVQLRDPQGAVLGTHRQATVRILDDEAPAVLDPSFNPPLLVPEVHALAWHTDGALLLGGGFGMEYPGYTLLYRNLARLHADGSLDTNFFPAYGGGLVRAILVVPGGGIVVGGDMNPRRLIRLKPDGGPDAAFAAPSLDDEVRAVARSGADQLLIGGEFTRLDGVERKRIARLNADGAIDSGFDPGSGANDQVLAVVEQADRRVVLGGSFTKVDGIRRPYLARLLENGRLDSSFAAVLNDRVRSVVLLENGRLLVGGRFTEVGGVARFYLARLNADGSLDTTFVPAAIDEEVRSVSVLPDGRIVIAGEFTTVGGQSRARIARLNADGSLDGLFHPGAGADGTVWAALSMADGSVVIGGEFWTVDGVRRSGVARLKAEQPPGLEIRAGMGGTGSALWLYGVPPHTYAVEASTDLTSWRAVGTRQLSRPAEEWPDPDAWQHPVRFYRAWRVGR